MRFSDLDGDRRMELRAVLESTGCEIDGYAGDGVLVSFERGRFSDTLSAAKQAGLEMIDAQLHYFPLGSDNPPDKFRHDGHYPGSRGFWFRGAFKVTE